MDHRNHKEAAITEKEEKVIPQRDKMGLVHALTILHHFRDIQRSLGMESELAYALDVIFEWIDNAVLLFYKFGSRSEFPPD